MDHWTHRTETCCPVCICSIHIHLIRHTCLCLWRAFVKHGSSFSSHVHLIQLSQFVKHVHAAVWFDSHKQIGFQHFLLKKIFCWCCEINWCLNWHWLWIHALQIQIQILFTDYVQYGSKREINVSEECFNIFVMHSNISFQAKHLKSYFNCIGSSHTIWHEQQQKFK